MRIGVEINWAHKPGGSRTVAKNILKNLAVIDNENEYVIFSNTFYPEFTPFRNVKQFVFPCPFSRIQHVWDQFIFPHYLLPKYSRRLNIDLMHYTNNLISISRPSSFVVTIHDLIPIIRPETQKLLHKIYQEEYFKYAGKRSKIIITVSKNSFQDIVRILGVNPNIIRIIPPAVGEEFQVIKDERLKNDIRKKYNLPERILLNVGSVQPGKNIHLLIEAFANLKSKNRYPHKLVIVGRKAWLVDELFNDKYSPEVKGEIIFTGPVPQEDLLVLYNLAEVFIYPSIYEGFGLPPLEAMACGIPVITSNCSSLPEVVGDHAILVNPYSVKDITNAMESILGDSGMRTRLAEGGLEQVKKFSWKRSAQQTLAVYKEIAAFNE